jgi:SAM-dependent methyltransferase
MRAWLQRLRRWATSPFTKPPVRPAGHLQHPTTEPAPEIALPTRQLAAALLARLSGESIATSYSDVQDDLLLFERLRDRLDSALEVEPNRHSVEHVACALHFVRHCAQTHGLPLRGAAHLEFGCGSLDPYGRMFSHLLLGAERAVCIEVDPVVDTAKALRRLARLAAAALVDPAHVLRGLPIARDAVLANCHGFDLARLAAGDPAGLCARLQLLQQPVQTTGLPTGAFDVTFSNSVFEHLDDVDATLAELRRITRPGGFGVHGIDATDHSRYWLPDVHPLEFLTADPQARFVHECNRWRLAEFEAAFARHGFTLVDAWRDAPAPIPAALRQRLAAPWRDRSDADLGVWWAQYLLRRE